MEKCFELTEEFKINVFGVKLFRIKATKKFKSIEIGTLGGFIEKVANLSGNAWVYGNAEVSGDARVSGNAEVSGNAWVYGNAEVSGNAWVSGDAEVYGNAEVSGDARVSGNAKLKSDKDFCWFSKFGSSNRTTTFFKTKEKSVIKVACGCFFGTFLEFKTKVSQTHKGTDYEKQYLLMCELAELKLKD